MRRQKTLDSQTANWYVFLLRIKIFAQPSKNDLNRSNSKTIFVLLLKIFRLSFVAENVEKFSFVDRSKALSDKKIFDGPDLDSIAGLQDCIAWSYRILAKKTKKSFEIFVIQFFRPRVKKSKKEVFDPKIKFDFSTNLFFRFFLFYFLSFYFILFSFIFLCISFEY